MELTSSCNQNRNKKSLLEIHYRKYSQMLTKSKHHNRSTSVLIYSYSWYIYSGPNRTCTPIWMHVISCGNSMAFCRISTQINMFSSGIIFMELGRFFIHRIIISQFCWNHHNHVGISKALKVKLSNSYYQFKSIYQVLTGKLCIILPESILHYALSTLVK